MPDVVTFDPNNLRIVEINSGLDENELDWFEIYSEYKVWLTADTSRMGYPIAFRQVGSDPISQTKNLGSSLFLGGGWKFRPAEYDHKVKLVGNVFAEGGVGSVVVPTLGGYTVLVEAEVSNLVDQLVNEVAAATSPTEVADAVWAYTIANALNPAVNLDEGTAGRLLAENNIGQVGHIELDYSKDPVEQHFYDWDGFLLLTRYLKTKDGEKVATQTGVQTKRLITVS